MNERFHSSDTCQSSHPGNGIETGFFDVINTVDKFEVKLDVAAFKPDEITVKTVEQEVIVLARHEERKCEHERICREQTRRCQLPKEVNPESVQSKLDTKGVLTIWAPKTLQISQGERVVTVQAAK